MTSPITAETIEWFDRLERLSRRRNVQYGLRNTARGKLLDWMDTHRREIAHALKVAHEIQAATENEK